MKKRISNVGASIRARLKAVAQRESRPFQEVLQYYGMERFLYRLSHSQHAEHFVLKGALMLQFWGGELSRSTKDIDLWGRVTTSPSRLVEVVKECLAIPVEDDGLVFDAESVNGEMIRANAKYDGVRLRFRATLDGADVPLQLDVGFGDCITPGPRELEYPSMLGLDSPQLWGYPPETAIAEKLEAMVSLEMANTRMKDFFDVWLLARRHAFSSDTLGDAIAATFQRRRTALPTSTPTALSSAFYGAADKQRQWRAYLRKARVQGKAPGLDEVAAHIEAFVMPVLTARAEGRSFQARWEPGGPWVSEE